MNVLKCVNLRGLNIRDVLVLEEVLFRKSKENWFLYYYECPKAVVVGFSGKIKELINVEDASKQKVQIIRRYTGGGTVIIDENTVFTTFIMNSNHVTCRPFPREIMEWSSQTVYCPIFNKILHPPHKFELREHDYAIDDRKVGGNAQSIIKDRWVHHTSFLWDYSTENMNLLQLPKKRPEYRQSRKHDEFLTKLKLYFDSILDYEKMVLSQLSTSFKLINVEFTNNTKFTQDIIENQDPKDFVRTREEFLENYMVEESLLKQCLVRQGPSCVNL